MFSVGGIASSPLAHCCDGIPHIGVRLVDLLRACDRDEFDRDLSFGKLIPEISNFNADAFAGENSSVDGLDVVVAATEFPPVPLVLVAPVRCGPTVK